MTGHFVHVIKRIRSTSETIQSVICCR